MRLGKIKFLRQNISTSLLDLLEGFRHSQCRDPRDKVYAPLALHQAVSLRKLRWIIQNPSVKFTLIF